MESIFCKCGNIRRPGGRYCNPCHAESMRAIRPTYSELSPEAKKKANARAYANAYQARGKLKTEPCVECGAKAQKHHEDYSKPLEVIWLCRGCHLDRHALEPKKGNLCPN